MSFSHLIIMAVLTCNQTDCPYHNDEFNYSVTFPNRMDVTVCVPDNPGGRHGARLIFNKVANCESLNEPSVGVSADYNSLDWPSSEVAAQKLCVGATPKLTNLKIASLPVAECRVPNRFVKGWDDQLYIAVSIPPHGGIGFIFSVGLSAPATDIEKYKNTALQILTTFTLDYSKRG